MAHGHSHDHGNGSGNYNTAFAVGVSLNLGFVVVEAVYGLLAHSLSLLADSGHNLSDVLGLLLAWAAMHLSRKRPTPRYKSSNKARGSAQ
jgi:cobalt-zinc-cadmium efflux system protein